MATTDNLGPMPTPVTLPARCRVPVVPAACSSSACTGSLGFACAGAGATATADPGCWPAATLSASAAAAAGLLGYGGQGYYSPAVACPVHYATAGGTATISAGDGDGNGDDVTVYRVHCCPSGYSRVQDGLDGRICQTEVSSTTYSARLCGGDGGGGGGEDNNDAAHGKNNNSAALCATTTTTTVISLPLTATDAFWGDTWTVTAQTLQAPAIEIRFRQSDLVGTTTMATVTTTTGIATTDTATTDTKETTTAAAVPTTPPPADVTAPDQGSSSPGFSADRLSRTAEIGLGVGIPVAGVTVLALAWVWFKGRRWK